MPTRYLDVTELHASQLTGGEVRVNKVDAHVVKTSELILCDDKEETSVIVMIAYLNSLMRRIERLEKAVRIFGGPRAT